MEITKKYKLSGITPPYTTEWTLPECATLISSTIVSDTTATNGEAIIEVVIDYCDCDCYNNYNTIELKITDAICISPAIIPFQIASASDSIQFTDLGNPIKEYQVSNRTRVKFAAPTDNTNAVYEWTYDVNIFKLIEQTYNYIILEYLETNIVHTADISTEVYVKAYTNECVFVEHTYTHTICIGTVEALTLSSKCTRQMIVDFTSFTFAYSTDTPIEDVLCETGVSLVRGCNFSVVSLEVFDSPEVLTYGIFNNQLTIYATDSAVDGFEYIVNILVRDERGFLFEGSIYFTPFFCEGTGDTAASGVVEDLLPTMITLICLREGESKALKENLPTLPVGSLIELVTIPSITTITSSAGFSDITMTNPSSTDYTESYTYYLTNSYGVRISELNTVNIVGNTELDLVVVVCDDPLVIPPAPGLQSTRPYIFEGYTADATSSERLPQSFALQGADIKTYEPEEQVSENSNFILDFTDSPVGIYYFRSDDPFCESVFFAVEVVTSIDTTILDIDVCEDVGIYSPTAALPDAVWVLVGTSSSWNATDETIDTVTETQSTVTFNATTTSSSKLNGEDTCVVTRLVRVNIIAKPAGLTATCIEYCNEGLETVDGFACLTNPSVAACDVDLVTAFTLPLGYTLKINSAPVFPFEMLGVTLTAPGNVILQSIGATHIVDINALSSGIYVFELISPEPCNVTTLLQLTLTNKAAYTSNNTVYHEAAMCESTTLDVFALCGINLGVDGVTIINGDAGKLAVGTGIYTAAAGQAVDNYELEVVINNDATCKACTAKCYVTINVANAANDENYGITCP